MIKVIDNKKIELTDYEWETYQNIVKSYNNVCGDGKILFRDLFETDNDGIILHLNPPSKNKTTMEVFLFLMSVYQSQHIRLMYSRIEDLCDQINQKMQEIDKKLDNK